MSLKYGVLSLVILLGALFFVGSGDGTWAQPALQKPEKEAAKKPEKSSETPPVAEPQSEAPDIKTYLSISEKNIFSPDRKEFPLPTSAGKKPVVRPQIVLYGVTIVGDYQSASVANPGRPLKKGEREAMSIKVGERIGDYKLAKILEDRIVMEGGEDSFEVLLYSKDALKKRTEAKTENKPAAITSTVGSGTPSTTPADTRRDVRPSPEVPPPPSRPIRAEALRPPSGRPTEPDQSAVPQPVVPSPSPEVTPPPPATPPMTPTPIPVPMTPTQITPPMIPQPIPVPPGMGRPIQPLSPTPSQPPGK